jgi:hypothetical protein
VLLARASDVDEILRLYEAHHTRFDGIHLSTTWRQLGRASWRDQEFLARDSGAALWPLREQTASMARVCKAWSLANIVHALSRLRLVDAGWERLWDALECVISRSLRRSPGDWSMRNIATVAHALARAGRRPPAVFDTVVYVTSPRLRQCCPRDMASIAWAIARSGHPAPSLMVRIEASASKLIPTLRVGDKVQLC